MGDKSVKVDYLSFTVPFYKRESYLEYLGSELIWLDYGFRGYKEGAIMSKGGRFGMTIGRDECHFDLPGTALRGYINDVVRLKGLFEMIIKDKGNVSRVDLAFDVKEGVEFNKVKKSVRLGCLVSKSRNVRIIESFENGVDGGKDKGGTIYIGSNKSNKMLRIYDKGKQEGLGERWVRFEMQLRDQVANKCILDMVNLDEISIVGYVVGVITGYVDFRSNKSLKNVTRRSRLLWFSKLVGSIEQVKFVIERVEKKIEEVVAWIDRQVGPSLAIVKRYFSDSFDNVLFYILLHGEQRLRLKHLVMLNGV